MSSGHVTCEWLRVKGGVGAGKVLAGKFYTYPDMCCVKSAAAEAVREFNWRVARRCWQVDAAMHSRQALGSTCDGSPANQK